MAINPQQQQYYYPQQQPYYQQQPQYYPQPQQQPYSYQAPQQPQYQMYPQQPQSNYPQNNYMVGGTYGMGTQQMSIQSQIQQMMAPVMQMFQMMMQMMMQMMNAMRANGLVPALPASTQPPATTNTATRELPDRPSDLTQSELNSNNAIAEYIIALADSNGASAQVKTAIGQSVTQIMRAEPGSDTSTQAKAQLRNGLTQAGFNSADIQTIISLGDTMALNAVVSDLRQAQVELDPASPSALALEHRINSVTTLRDTNTVGMAIRNVLNTSEDNSGANNTRIYNMLTASPESRATIGLPVAEITELASQAGISQEDINQLLTLGNRYQVGGLLATMQSQTAALEPESPGAMAMQTRITALGDIFHTGVMPPELASSTLNGTAMSTTTDPNAFWGGLLDSINLSPPPAQNLTEVTAQATTASNTETTETVANPPAENLVSTEILPTEEVPA